MLFVSLRGADQSLQAFFPHVYKRPSGTPIRESFVELYNNELHNGPVGPSVRIE